MCTCMQHRATANSCTETRLHSAGRQGAYITAVDSHRIVELVGQSPTFACPSISQGHPWNLSRVQCFELLKALPHFLFTFVAVVSYQSITTITCSRLRVTHIIPLSRAAVLDGSVTAPSPRDNRHLIPTSLEVWSHTQTISQLSTDAEFACKRWY